ncbi:hypothetical protein BDR26DRAFT_912625 [Obelidium mucronatum]|nr:hypothetical protein BDR26DRAFT_912625 [Obelidium mucronatum]
MPSSRHLSRLVGVAMTPLNSAPAQTPAALVRLALGAALASVPARGPLTLGDVTGLIAVPSLAAPRFMEAHHVATLTKLLPAPRVACRTIDTGGAGPVSALLSAARMAAEGPHGLVAVVAGDAVKNLDSKEFLRRADATCAGPEDPEDRDPDYEQIPSPVIPNGYDRVARYQMEKFGVTRNQLAACSALMSIMASRHPDALTRKPRTIAEVLNSRHVAPVTSVLECARRADGGAALLIASNQFMEKMGIPQKHGVVVVGGGEASGPLYPPIPSRISEEMFSCEQAAEQAYNEAQVGVNDIDFFGLYDCFPICLIRAVEAVGLCGKGQGGLYIEHKYNEIQYRLAQNPNFLPQQVFPINTHGGLQAFGAPWEVPAMYNIIEAFHQLSNTAGSRQVQNARRALVYGNGGIFSHSAVAILGNGRY